MNGFKEARNCLMGIVLREEFAISRRMQSVSWVRMMGRSPFPTIRSKHATVWNRFCKHTTIALPTQVGLELAPHHVSTGCMPKPLLLHCSTWSWVWTQHRWRNSASVYTMLSKEIKLKARALSPPAEGDVSWDSVHRISVLWILGNPEVHTHLFVPGAWLPSRNKSWTPSYQCRTVQVDVCLGRRVLKGSPALGLNGHMVLVTKGWITYFLHFLVVFWSTVASATSSPKLMFCELSGGLKSGVGIFTLWKWASTKEWEPLLLLLLQKA